MKKIILVLAIVCFLTAVPVVVRADVYQDITNQLIVFLTKLIAQLQAQIDQIKRQTATQSQIKTPVNNPPVTNDYCNALYDEIFGHYRNSQKCSEDSECAIMTGVNFPCSISNCADAYNKNYDLTRLKSLSKTYISSSCEQECPGGGCLDLAGRPLKCIKNKCTISTTQTNYTQTRE